MDKWAIHIDMEGFSSLWEKEDKILLSLGELMRAIFRIARIVYPDSPERIFAHQIGDGFIIKSDFYEKDLERVITIAAALMQHVAFTGRFAKAAIAEGDLSDIRGCYPREVIDNLEDNYIIPLGMGRMSIFPVMGTALIRSVQVANDSPCGPLLTIEASKKDRIPPMIQTKPIIGKKYDLLSIDWVHAESELLQKIKHKADLNQTSTEILESILKKYCEEHDLPLEWKANSYFLLNLPLR